MAVYKKKNYRSGRERDTEHDGQIHDDSTTAEVFESLDEGASKAEKWAEKYKNIIIGAVILLAVIGIGVFLYQQYVVAPKEQEASNEFFFAQQYFDNALLEQDAKVKDSLFQVSLTGANGKYGFLDLIEEYSGTKAANLAHYSAGMAYVNMGKYEEAIPYLKDFNSEDAIMGALALGNIGDAYAQLKNSDEAFSFYKKAFESDDNTFTTSMYLKKAGIVSMELGKNEEAAKYFERIKNDYPNSTEARTIDIFIGKATAK